MFKKTCGFHLSPRKEDPKTFPKLPAKWQLNFRNSLKFGVRGFEFLALPRATRSDAWRQIRGGGANFPESSPVDMAQEVVVAQEPCRRHRFTSNGLLNKGALKGPDHPQPRKISQDPLRPIDTHSLTSSKQWKKHELAVSLQFQETKHVEEQI